MKVNILVVEDEGIVAKDVRGRLQRLGYDVADVVATGEEAIIRAGELRPDLVLMDIMLRGKIDGIEAAGIIRETCNIPVLYLTAYSDQGTLERAKITAPYGYILKPLDERELHITIEMALYRHSMEMKLKEREQWLSFTLKSIGDAVVATDREGRITFMNPVAENLTNCKVEDAMGEYLLDVVRIVHKENLQVIECPASKAMRQGAITTLPTDSILIPMKEESSGPEVWIDLDDSAAPIINKSGAVVGAVVIFRDATDRMKEEGKIRHRAYHDQLTGLPNRFLFDDRLSMALFDASRRNQLLAVVFLDLDDFKPVNDTLGHDAGDILLAQAAARLTGCVRNGDTVARIGGDEFAIVLPSISRKEETGEIVRRHLDALKRPFIIGEQEILISASAGISIFPEDGDNVQTLMKKADRAMYASKATGKNGYSFFEV